MILKIKYLTYLFLIPILIFFISGYVHVLLCKYYYGVKYFSDGMLGFDLTIKIMSLYVLLNIFYYMFIVFYKFIKMKNIVIIIFVFLPIFLFYYSFINQKNIQFVIILSIYHCSYYILFFTFKFLFSFTRIA